jgi:hypothetical protein
MVQAGYRSPAELRGINFKGFRPVHVETLKQLEKINPKEEIAIMSSNLGLKKKLAIVKSAEGKNIKFTNIKDEKKFVADIESQMKARKEARKIAVEKKTKSEKKEEKKAKTQEKKPEIKPVQHAIEPTKTHEDKTQLVAQSELKGASK